MSVCEYSIRGFVAGYSFRIQIKDFILRIKKNCIKKEIQVVIHPRKTTVVADEVNESEENLEMDETPILEEPKVEVSNIKAKKPKAGQSDSDLLDFPSEEEY